MLRIRITPDRQRPLPAFRYTDSVHAALIHAFAAAGKPGADLIGEEAPPWTFAAEGFAIPGGRKRLRELVVATADAGLADLLIRLRPEMVRIRSTNGDRIDLSGGRVTEEPDPIAPEQGALFVRPLSPVAIGRRRTEREGRRWAESIDEIDLSAALSVGLSRRLKRPIAVQARVDRLSVASRGRKAALVRVRAANGRDIFIPAFDFPLTLTGTDEDLRAAWYAGLGEKCRFGFGCLALPHLPLA